MKIRATLACATALTLVVACGSDNDESPDRSTSTTVAPQSTSTSTNVPPTSDPDATDTTSAPPATVDDTNAPDRLMSGDGYSVEGALSELPAELVGDAPVIWSADLAAISTAAGIDRPSEADPEAVRDWLLPLTGIPTDDTPVAPIFVPLADVFQPNSLAMVDEIQAELGWSIVDADAFVEVTEPPHRFSVITGAFDSNPLNPELPEVAPAVVTAGEGDDLATLLDARTAARPLGRPLRMAYDGDRIAASLSTPSVERWLAGTYETVADDAAISAVARALDDADVLAALIAQGGSVADSMGMPVSEAQLEQIMTELSDVLPDPFGVAGVGWALDDSGAGTITVAYHFGTAEVAEANRDRVDTSYTEASSLMTREPISERLTLDRVDVAGPVVIATLHPVEPVAARFPFQALFNRDIPFVYR